MYQPRQPRPQDKLIDRDPQHLPIPIGGFSPVRRPRRPTRIGKFWRRNAASILTVVGMLAAAGGVALTVSAPPIPVYMSADQIHIGATVLTHAAGSGLPAGSSLYSGNATYVLTMNPDGSMRAAAVTFANVLKIDGSCVMAAPVPTGTGLIEQCSFLIGGKSLTAQDVLNFNQSGHWSRTYSDGSKVSIGVPPAGGVIPVPFPIGK